MSRIKEYFREMLIGGDLIVEDFKPQHTFFVDVSAEANTIISVRHGWKNS
jgi:hypothetical protein